MILDARKGDRQYRCYDAKACRAVRGVVWVDDETAQWGHYVIRGREVTIKVKQEESITIYQDRKLVVFNQVDDREKEDCYTTAHNNGQTGKATEASWDH